MSQIHQSHTLQYTNKNIYGQNGGSIFDNCSKKNFKPYRFEFWLDDTFIKEMDGI